MGADPLTIGLIIASTAISTGVGAASAAGAFDKDPGSAPGRSSAEIARAASLERRRAALARGRQSTILSQGASTGGGNLASTSLLSGK